MPEGRTYMLLGESGSGKSILLYKLMDLYIRSSRPCIYVALDAKPTPSISGRPDWRARTKRKGRPPHLCGLPPLQGRAGRTPSG
jgi:ABC-type dipeptide/oligopeptide/nickel transport system ATPase component